MSYQGSQYCGTTVIDIHKESVKILQNTLILSGSSRKELILFFKAFQILNSIIFLKLVSIYDMYYFYQEEFFY